jgi:hypothetical protein
LNLLRRRIVTDVTIDGASSHPVGITARLAAPSRSA